MLACYVALKAGRDEVPWPRYSLPVSLLNLKDYDVSSRRRWDVDRLFRDVFFESLAFYFKLDFETTDLWLARLELESSWVAGFMISLIELAAESAKRLKRSNRPTWEWFFSELSRIALPVGIKAVRIGSIRSERDS